MENRLGRNFEREIFGQPDVIVLVGSGSSLFAAQLDHRANSPLAERANLTIDVGAGPELAIPASKSVSCTIAILLTAASLRAADGTRDPAVLLQTAQTIREWLRDSAAPSRRLP
ncbi:MAG TPA: hypothetical protein VKB39_05750, partial [Candidatus Baltobacteraceae bacterium]|nr:hypothetical protein [Candidatus Baltobacteraceae bacterium]